MKRGVLARWRQFLMNRLRTGRDGEHEMLANRLAIGAIAMLYALLGVDDDLAASTPLVGLCTCFFAGTLALMIHALRWPGVSFERRLVGIVLDTGALSAALFVGGEVASPFFPVYLWVILGNGFRFGVTWLRAATVASAAGFSAVVVATPYWWGNHLLGIGLLAGLVAIPLYAQLLIRKLSDAKTQAEAASRAKSLFLASVSHELRTPLNAVIGMSGLIASTPLDAAQREMTDTIGSASASLLSLIDKILDLSRIEAGQMPTVAVPFELDKLLRQAMAVIEVRAREKGLHVGLHITAHTPLDVLGDAGHLQDILLNLLGNAVKFTAAGSVMLTVDAVAAAPGLASYRFEVSDTGIGIAQAAQAHIFEDFVQADSTIMNRFGGTGLGLAITRRLVTLLGGAIELHSVEGKGSTFAVTLPMGWQDVPVACSGLVMAAPEDRVALRALLERLQAMGCTVASEGSGSREAVTLVRPHARAGSQDGPAVLVVDRLDGLLNEDARKHVATAVSLDAPDRLLAGAIRIAQSHAAAHPPPDNAIWVRPRPLRVLVADDNRVNTRVLEMMLGRAGHSVTAVGNGEEALDALEENRFDVVLMDLNMPVMDGLKATKLLRFGALGGPHVPVIGLTADITGGVRERCREAGMDTCLSKPVEARVLLDTLDDVVGHGATQRTPGLDQANPVTAITAHPSFRPVAGPAVDPAALDRLRLLGGDEFLRDLADEFLGDAERLCAALQQAAVAGDGAAIAFGTHALLSVAGNIGAEPLRLACRAIQNMPPRELAQAGAQGLPSLMAELRRVRVELHAACLLDKPVPAVLPGA